MSQLKTTAPPTTWGGAVLGRRSSQQDSFLIEPLDDGRNILALVADGMGGHAEGALASQTVAASFSRSFLRLRAEAAGVEAALRDALDEANQAVAAVQQGRPERQGMGTTLVAAYVSDSALAWISVGDSALLLCRDREVRRLNDDHSLRALPEYGGKQGNVLRSAVVGGEIALIDCHADPFPLEAGDVLVLASDGILTLSHGEILELLDKGPACGPEALGSALLRAVERKGDPKQDNCSVITLCGFGAPPPRAPSSGAATTSRLLIPLGIAALLVCAALAALFW